MQMTHHSGADTPRAVVARTDASFPWYIGAAFAVALAGGFALALLLPLAAALGWDWGLRWRALVQAHGHLQIVGWLGLFIAGMAFRLAPRFAGQPLRFAAATGPALALLLFGVLGRAAAQPWLEDPAVRGVLVVSLAAELAGAALFAVALIATLAPAARTLAPAPFLMLGALGLFVQALLGILWLPSLTAETPFLTGARNTALLAVQFYAFVLPFVLGVSLRALPTFFARPSPDVRLAWLLAVMLGIGAAVKASGPALFAGSAGVRTEAAGSLLVAAAVAGAIALTGVWRQPERLRASARHAALLVRTAYAWLALVAAALAVTAVRSLLSGDATPPAEVDAIRHLLALGAFTTLLVGMAYLMLPWMAMRRMKPAAARLETRVLWALLTLSTVLRAGGALLEGWGADRYWMMALGGVFAVAAIAFFAVVVLRAARQEPPEITLHERRS